MEYLAGKLLVATPATGGDIFHRAVVVVLHHDADGAHGLVLNKPLTVGVETVLPTWPEHVSDPNRLFQGGPVGLDTALGLAWVPGGSADEVGLKLLHGSIAVIDLDAPPEIVTPEIAGLRIFAGYSGWGPSQLEGEIAAHGWYVVDLEPADAFGPDPENLWSRVLGRQRGSMAWAARYPEDPSLN